MNFKQCQKLLGHNIRITLKNDNTIDCFITYVGLLGILYKNPYALYSDTQREYRLYYQEIKSIEITRRNDTKREKILAEQRARDEVYNLLVPLNHQPQTFIETTFKKEVLYDNKKS